MPAARLAALGSGHWPRRDRHCLPTCYQRVIICNLKSTFDPYSAPMSPWRAGQRVAESTIRRQPVDSSAAFEASASIAVKARERLGGREKSETDRTSRDAERTEVGPELRVLFVNRTRTKFSRSLANIWSLMQRCNGHRWARRWARSTNVVCSVHEFGAGSLARDVRAARAADVLVGTHGAGLANAFFMRRGASLLEVRPYRFEGSWPDKYFRALTSLDRAVHYYQVSAGSADLSEPRPKDDVSVWDARDHAVRLPWRTLREALHVILEVNSSLPRYMDRLWKQGTIFVSQPAPDR